MGKERRYRRILFSSMHLIFSGAYHGSQGLEQGPMVISNSANHKTTVSSNESKPDQAAQSTSDGAPGLAEFCQFVSGTPVPPQQPIRVQF